MAAVIAVAIIAAITAFAAAIVVAASDRYHGKIVYLALHRPMVKIALLFALIGAMGQVALSISCASLIIILKILHRYA